jgi:membrane-associated phospholipid phosphatase
MPENVLEAGIALVLWIQGLGEWLLVPMRIFSFVGTEDFYLLVMPALVWCLDFSLGIRVGLMLLISGGVNSALKLAFHDPRPFWINRQVSGYAFESSYGLPSGHAQNAVAIWGLLAASIRKGWAWASAVGLIALIGFSRMYLGVHFPTDVLVGWLIGVVILVLFLILENPVTAWLSGLSLWQIGAVLLLASAAIIGFGALILGRNQGAGWSLPVSWQENASAAFPSADPIDPDGLSGLITAGSSFFGFGIGAAWIRKRGGFDASGSLRNRIFRFGLGIAGVLVLAFGLGAIFPSGEYLAAYIMRFLRYSLVTGWISGIAPYLFIQLGLAEHTD